MGIIADLYREDMLQQIHREIQVLQQLVQQMRNKLCPFVNKIFECLETSNHIYIVLEYCNEGTLLTHIKKRNKRIPEDEAVMILYQLASALDFITEGGVAHRDIKPENVFIKDGVFKLGDFGFAGQKQMY
jgi:serine/threonine protein kinase